MNQLFRLTIKKTFKKLGIPKRWIFYTIGEFKLLWVRLFSVLPWQRVKLKKIKQIKHLNLLFGCGDTRYANWIGIDCFFGPNVDLKLDLRRPLPFATNSVEFCYSEHFLEHLYPEEGFDHLKEVYRILKPGGVYRIALPDAIKFADKYIQNDTEFFNLAFPWATRPMQAVYSVFNWEGEHRNIFDENEVTYMAKMANFAEIHRSEANQSTYPELRIDTLDPQRVAETFYCELVKK